MQRRPSQLRQYVSSGGRRIDGFFAAGLTVGGLGEDARGTGWVIDFSGVRAGCLMPLFVLPGYPASTSCVRPWPLMGDHRWDLSNESGDGGWGRAWVRQAALRPDWKAVEIGKPWKSEIWSPEI